MKYTYTPFDPDNESAGGQVNLVGESLHERDRILNNEGKSTSQLGPDELHQRANDLANESLVVTAGTPERPYFQFDIELPLDPWIKPYADTLIEKMGGDLDGLSLSLDLQGRVSGFCVNPYVVQCEIGYLGACVVVLARDYNANEDRAQIKAQRFVMGELIGYQPREPDMFYQNGKRITNPRNGLLKYYDPQPGLWGRFNMPEPRPVEPVMLTDSKGNRGSWMWLKLGGKSERTKELRSATPMGFAKAFKEANP